MKILHTSDWHLGKRLERFSRMDEQQQVLKEIIDISEREQVDAILIAGDLFDQFNPPAEAIELFYKSLKELSREGKCLVFAIAGNHDSPERIEAPDPLARSCGIVLSGYPLSRIPDFSLNTGLHILRSESGFTEFSLPGVSYPLRIFATPFANDIRLKMALPAGHDEEELRTILSGIWEEKAREYADEKGVNLMMAHLYMRNEGEEGFPEPEDEKPILQMGGAQVMFPSHLPQAIQYCALGHLHHFHTLGPEHPVAAYPGSPLAYSFSEAGQKKSVLIVEIEPGSPPWIRPVFLQSGLPLYRKRFESIPNAIEWLGRHTESWVELTIASPTFLSGADQKALFAAHPGIVSLIPEIQLEFQDQSGPKLLDPNGKLEDLFIEYFVSQKNNPPPESILDLFREILSGEDQE